MAEEIKEDIPKSTSNISVPNFLEGKHIPAEMDDSAFILAIDADLLDMCLIMSGTDEKEWIATNTLGFFTVTNLISSSIVEFCTVETCPEMTAGYVNYLWHDEKATKMSKLPACNYINLAITYIQNQLQDEKIFPTNFGHNFDDNFLFIIKRTYSLLVHIIGHLYFHHFQIIRELKLHGYLNSFLLHFSYFIQSFKLLESSDLEPLLDLISVLQIIDKNELEIKLEDDEIK